jgi:serine/threonine protein kinase
MLAPNTLLHNRYLVVRPLGQGGMGAVYQATDQTFGSTVALKETFSHSDRLRKAFAHEARLLNRLRHAGLPVVIDYFAVGERQFLVMQYIPGKNLEQLLEERMAKGQGPFLPSQVLSWADQLLDALEYLHAHKPPVIHRDIKPQNLKLTPRSEVILLDFGLAKGVATRMSQAGRSIRGYTPNYAALEQIRGTGTDVRSDLYSVAATLYHLLTGEMPPCAMTRAAAMLMGQPDPLQPVHQLNPQVPAEIATVLARAMSQHPNQRYATAGVMRQALRHASRAIPPISLHRSPTLINEPLEDRGAAAAVEPLLLEQPPALPLADKPGFLVPAGAGQAVVLLQEDGPSPLPSAPDARDQAPKPIEAAPATQRRWRSAWLIGFAVGLALLVGAILAYRFWSARLPASTGPAVLVSTAQSNLSGTALAIPMRTEVLRYCLEVAPSGGGSTRATGLEPLAADCKFKFHFQPRESGYLYIITLGKSGLPQTFLTAQPMPASGVTTNWVEAGSDFQFPDGGQWLVIQRDAITAPFTVIFSPWPLEAPSFLAAPAGQELTAAEAQELAELRRRMSASAPEVVATVNDNQPTVIVQVPAERDAGEPLIIDISIKQDRNR